MKYLICVVAVLFCANSATAGCPGGQCKTPVRTAIHKTVKGVVHVAKAPCKCRCRCAKGCCK